MFQENSENRKTAPWGAFWWRVWPRGTRCGRVFVIPQGLAPPLRGATWSRVSPAEPPNPTTTHQERLRHEEGRPDRGTGALPGCRAQYLRRWYAERLLLGRRDRGPDHTFVEDHPSTH